MAILLTKSEHEAKPKLIPLVPIRHGVIYPHTESIIQFGRTKSIAGIQAAEENDKKVILVSQKDTNINDPAAEDLYEVGTLCEVERTLKTNGEMNAFVKGISRVKIVNLQSGDAFFQAEIKEIPEIIEESDEIEALVKHITGEFKRAVNLGKAVDVMHFMKLMSGVEPVQLADQVASTLEAPTPDKQKILETIALKERLQQVSELLSHEIKILEIERNIANKTQRKFDKSMRDTVLRERLKTIQKELGEADEDEQEIIVMRRQIKKLLMPKKVEIKALKELSRLAKISPHNPEYGYIRTWLETLIELPWKSSSQKPVFLKKAQEVLDEDHYGLEEVKERIVEYLAVLKLKENQIKDEKEKAKTADGETDKEDKKIPEKAIMPTVLCFVGAPGVGKTSIGKSIAKALDRKFVKVSLGGLRDEAEIRGHRRTYVGAMPGRIIQGMQNADTINPVFMLDEIDKVGTDFRGDPASALLEALDPEQNHGFSDHYLEVPYDLSNVMFIATANTLDSIPPALRDRLEIIRFSGYTIMEKFHIAKKHLLNKALERNGLVKEQVDFTDEALETIIKRYTREAGVRSLEREILKICRKVARKIAEGKTTAVKITNKNIQSYLGPFIFGETTAEKKDAVGMATGMAWTQVGGDILFIEVATMPGKGRLILTGQLGDVMKESAQAGWSYIRSQWKALGLNKNFHKDIDIHIHIPEGAIPKDGPSAGVTMTTAMVSALTKTPARRDVAMTGEITLRGRVLEIGGVKEKVIAAHRAGIKEIILPQNNKKDLVKVPHEVTKEVNFKFVNQMDQVLKNALVAKQVN
jgi:ATP-dependent Lon protease